MCCVYCKFKILGGLLVLSFKNPCGSGYSLTTSHLGKLPRTVLLPSVRNSFFIIILQRSHWLITLCKFQEYITIFQFLYRLHYIHHQQSSFYPSPYMCAPLPLLPIPPPSSPLVTTNLFSLCMCLSSQNIPYFKRVCLSALCVFSVQHGNEVSESCPAVTEHSLSVPAHPVPRTVAGLIFLVTSSVGKLAEHLLH